MTFLNSVIALKKGPYPLSLLKILAGVLVPYIIYYNSFFYELVLVSIPRRWVHRDVMTHWLALFLW